MDRLDRKIIHLDMDAFYASIEIRDHPELAGKPVGVGGARNERGVLTTCNYEARKYGVRSAMPTFMALQKCPQLILLPTRFDVYRRDSGIIRSILARYTPLIEPLSLDEAYLDVSAHEGDPAALAYVIRQQIFQKTKLTASAGIAPNKLLAKIASDWRKPNGQFQIKPEEVPDFIASVPVTKLWGVGHVGAVKLEKLNVATCGDLQRLSRLELTEHFGKFGLDLYQQCRGIDDRPVEPDRERRSLSNERTFSLDLLTPEQCLDRLPELHAELVADLAKQTHTPPLAGIFLKLKFNDFSRTSVDRTGLAPILVNYRLLLEEAFARTGKPVRLIGVGVRFADHVIPGVSSQLEFVLE
ncbi:MAG TPA: DNA polymerase IV [Chthoniobacterales bacterium]